MQNKEEFLPLKTYVNIVEGNALRLDWNDVVHASKLNYIMGNPPFVGARMMEQGGIQKKEVQDIFGKIKDVQDLDYVTCWYKKASEYIQGRNIEVAFVSTNSICQGSQVPILWKILLDDYTIHINFAYHTFRWNSESLTQATVHCIIVGFSNKNRDKKLLYSADGSYKIVSNITPYLTEGDDIFVTASNSTLCNVPKMSFGNQPRDGGNFIFTEEEKDELLRVEPELQKYFRVYMGADEFIKGKKRYCLWFAHITPAEIKKSKIIYNIVEKVRDFRLASKAKTTKGYAKVPHCFAQMTQPEDCNYLIVPCVSSENRRYIPIGFMNKNVISSNAVQIIPNAELYHFGILESLVHMAWMRVVAGRLKSDYRYSKDIVYNNFVWCEPTDEQKQKIEETAQKILDARALYPDSSLADLYDELTMPIELRKAHQANDRAVIAAYGFKKDITEDEIVAELFKLYEKKIKEL